MLQIVLHHEQDYAILLAFSDRVESMREVESFCVSCFKHYMFTSVLAGNRDDLVE